MKGNSGLRPGSLTRILGLLGVATVLATLTCLSALAYMTAAPKSVPRNEIFPVAKGESLASVAGRLETSGWIRSSLAFHLLARVSGSDSKLKAGSYRLESGMDSKRILDLFVSGKQALVRFTLPEGYSLNQVADLLSRAGISTVEDFQTATRSKELLAELGIPASTIEGYLFPDTYFFPAAFGGANAARAMVAAFRERISSLPEAEFLSPKELHTRIIVASIVEREYRLAEEAPLMAGVFYNRLRIRMALQSCATVVYVITERLRKPHPETLYDRDLKIEDPYNTYIHRGLPPGPISNPGMTAIEAAIRPRNSDYLYFRLVDADTGRHHFSRSLEEHIGARSLAVKRVGG